MATIREWLLEAGYNERRGTLVVRDLVPREKLEEQGYGQTSYPGHVQEAYQLQLGELADLSHPLVNKEFHNGLGAPECPRFMARCGDTIFLPGPV